jgi:hypothetical protein
MRKANRGQVVGTRTSRANLETKKGKQIRHDLDEQLGWDYLQTRAEVGKFGELAPRHLRRRLLALGKRMIKRRQRQILRALKEIK